MRDDRSLHEHRGQPTADGRPRRAVILAAGLGTRLGAATHELPKCLVEVAGIPILFNALDRLAEAGFVETILVVGYLEHTIRARVGRTWRSMKVSYRINADYRTTGTSRSLWLGVEEMNDDVVLLEGDVFFEARVLGQLLATPEPDVTVVEPWTPALDGSVVKVARDRTVSAWIHKKDRPSGMVPEGTCKTVNIHRLSAAFVRDRLRPALAAEVTSNGGVEPLETVFAGLVRAGARIHTCPPAGRWVEIDDARDLRTAEDLFQETSHDAR
jgi:choline kinase